MKYIISIFLFCLLLVNVHSQPISVKGIITNENNKAVLYATIINKTNGQTYTSNSFGAFILNAMYGDTIILSATSYKTNSIVLNFNTDTLLRIVMYKQKAIPAKRKFADRDSVAIRIAGILKTNPLLNNYERIEKWPGKKIEFSVMPYGVVASGVISALWYKYSDRGQEMRKLLHLLDLYKQQNKATEKLTPAYVMNSFGCDEQKAKQIIASCNLSSDFILKASDYDLIEKLKKCANN